MVVSRWRQRAGPGLLALGLAGLLGPAPAGALDATWIPPSCPTGAFTRPAADAGDPATAAWYRMDPVLDEAGTLAAQRLVAGGGSARPRSLDLDAESFAAGPFGAVVLAGSDDGRRSTLRLIDLTAGCATSVANERDVIRGATLAPGAAAIYEHRVERATRTDRGVWRRPLDGSVEPERVLPPIAPDDRFGRTFLTELSWSADRSTLVVQTCGQVACRTRLLDVAAGRVTMIEEPDLGDALGVAGDRLVAYLACRGLPCPIVSVDVATGARTVVTEAAGFATLVETPGNVRLAYEDGTRPDTPLHLADVTGRALGRIDALPGMRLVPGPMRAQAGVAAPAGWLAFAPDGRPAIDAANPGSLRHAVDGRLVALEEAAR
jgi:hypothetical protein